VVAKEFAIKKAIQILLIQFSSVMIYFHQNHEKRLMGLGKRFQSLSIELIMIPKADEEYEAIMALLKANYTLQEAL
jgi:hypothetical protein